MIGLAHRFSIIAKSTLPPHIAVIPSSIAANSADV
jgi:hypothetical protein